MWIAFATIAVCTVTGCGGSAITADHIERAVETTFANRVAIQVTWLKLPPMDASTFDVIASCRRSATGSRSGAGEWVCQLRWLGPDRQVLHDTFDLSVTTDGCYTATAEGETLGGPTLRASDGSDVRNLLYVFEGCFATA